MNKSLEAMRTRVRAGEHHHLRKAASPDIITEANMEDLSWMQRSARRTRRMCEAETPVVLPGENILFTRTIVDVPPLYMPGQYARRTKDFTLHELGPISNICADWGKVIASGLLVRRQVAESSRQRLIDDPEAVTFLDSAIETIDAVLDLAARYARAARRSARPDLAAILERVPAHPARTFHEALQSLRLLHAVVWMSGHYHVGLGRFDQYMWPYLQADLEEGRLDQNTAEALLAEFFISLNKDSDLYPGVQQGDNGQSMTIGGVDSQGQEASNPLTLMVLRVARDVGMIDPKINLRISPETELDTLALATELTRKGLGFPQYANDNVVIPALVDHGYALEDARNYTVAACWEFIIPGKGMEVVNIGAVSFPYATDQALRSGLQAGESFDQILDRAKVEIRQQVERMADAYQTLFLPPAPYYSVLMDGCLECGRDLSQGLTYNNFGLHGACSANGADALAAVKTLVFEQEAIAPDDLLSALEQNFVDAEDLRAKLQHQAPKVGCGQEVADQMLTFLFDAFADACERYGDNGRGGRIRPGTGSAMYYVWLARGQEDMREPVVGATADGRHEGDFFSVNLAPSLGTAPTGPLSTFLSFCELDYNRICNGGPITIELSDTVFRGAESIRKVAMLVRSFAQLGCQQLQINSLDVATLLKARQNPDQYPNLIVRVWGWSGYFCELAPEYQDHILQRCMYQRAG